MHFYMPNLKEVANSALNRLKIGSYCVLCNRPSRQKVDLCGACHEWLTPRAYQRIGGVWSYLCVLCGEEQTPNGLVCSTHDAISVNKTADALNFCQSCQNIDGAFRRIVAPYRYEFPLDQIIGRMKYGQRRVFGRVLGELLASAVEPFDSLPDVIVPVPLHAARQAERGYNQAADIARWCAAGLALPCQPWLVSRVFDTGSLAGLSKASRQHRILGAFSAASEVRGCRIAIVDDVLTTGATARELARELYDTGAVSVELWVLARTSSER